MSRYPAIDVRGALVAVTGAGRGIGAATARAFVEAGAHVALGDLDADAAAATAAGLGPLAGAHPLDVTDKWSFAAFLAHAESRHGRPLDILVNNAGVMPNGPFLDQDEDLDRLTMEVNVFGLVHGMRLALPGMVERGRGHIVNVCSLAGKFPLAGLAMYNASKYAAVGLTAATRLEHADTGVSITAVLPSAVRTELSAGIDYGVLPAVDPEDVAAAIVGTVASRAAEVAVPGYLGPAADAATLVPERVMRVLRRLAGDDAAITRVDTAIRSAYVERIRRR
ncbi:SDR family oxidoreductase [Nocardia farcinica]|uniref:Sorbitol dehydrogenase n=1 Tax=Nocardia farcinica TaxID=37329 RepID=A0A0H5NN06_NOCFR|nr:SDR family oxidoreductase [Nocardia farcinica]AXK85241.1 SDR family oxidoreductase [Nocardia farcinica]MBA4858700.1 SDR family oxidoreductase [Nocardia farcinica]MBC9817992.1 SDR family oxidoreductase [Nocardia farcinica]MBF6140187.1 SDR family oxidoreductase [Nocardia farcinica]MBF6387421.1 SDR family oxidoreductase [Nocardia farcinica]